MSTTIVLVRHGQTDWNVERRFQGRADIPLNATGRAQAAELAELLADHRPTIVYSSPLLRALETAEIVADRLRAPVRTSESLLEVDVGSWSGLTRAEVEARFPEGYRRWFAHGHGWDDGETYEELEARVVSGLISIAALHHGERLLAVTHGGPIRSALAAAAGLDFGQVRRSIAFLENCAAVSVAVRDGAIEAVD
ncbi:MAG TPA: histidine phosphatase family protein [Gaiellaceae bacterium]|nr:histidine phosphatase family protein [Gaiellaceae bacterium]